MLQDEEYDSDTSDEDFVPEGVVESDDDAVSDGDEDEGDDAGEGDEETTAKGKKKKQRRKGKQKKSNDVNKEEGEDESEKEKNKEVDKKKEESIWADFLADVEDKPSPPPKPKASSWGALLGNKKTSTDSSSSTTAKPSPAPKKEDKKESSSKPETVKITQVYEFAGEEVKVEKEVDANSVEAQAAKCSAALASEKSSSPAKGPPGVGAVKRSGGLAGLVGLLDSKKQKLTTLEKTKLDWNAFKSEEGIDAELEKHKKSKDGYLDKQAFLERADLRQFEIERAMRMSKRSNR